MSPTQVTKMLLLGAVAIFEPVNGYQIRRELLSWGVQNWANLNPGSIYNGLGSLTKAGCLTRHDLPDGGREVAVYQATELGLEQHLELVLEALATPITFTTVAFEAAFTQAGLIDRQQFLTALRKRSDALADSVAQHPEMEQQKASFAPPIVMRSMSLWLDQAAAERVWLRETIAQIEAGRYQFRGEPMDWDPPQDDPGQQMSRDRDKYRRQLGLQ